MKNRFVAQFVRHAAVAMACVFGMGCMSAAMAETAQGAGKPASPGMENNVPVVSDTLERKIVGHMQESNVGRLRGWPGVIFYCPTDEAKTPALREVCVESYKNLEALAVQYGVNFHKARNANDVAVLPHLTGRLKLVIEITATEPNAAVAAMAARIAVLAHYTHAINRSAELHVPTGADAIQEKHPLNVPQHVDGLLWEASLIKAAAGSQEALVRPVADGINQKLKGFFLEYAKANR